MVMGIIVALLLLVPIAYSSYIVPLVEEGPEVSLKVIEPIAAPNVTVPEILGASVDWTDNANGLYDDVSGLLNPAPVAQLIKLDPSHLRFPATRLSQVYDWKLGVGNPSERGFNPSHGGDSQSSLFGTDEFFKLVDHVGSRAVMVVNSNTGSALSASDWVSYCNDDQYTRLGKDRASNGYINPYRIKDWEIGYEAYVPKYWEGISTTERGAGTLYGELVVNYSEAMKKIDPSIKVGAWMVLHPDKEQTSADSNWNNNFLRAAGGQFNLPGADPYYFDYVVVKVELPDIDLLLNYPDLYRYSYAQTLKMLRDHLAQVRGLLATLPRNPIPVAFACFEPDFGPGGWNTQAPSYAASALITADLAMQMLNVAMEDGKQSVRYACYGELNTPTYSSLMINPDFEWAHIETWGQSPNYLAFEMATALQGGKPLVVTEISPVTYSVDRGGELPALRNVPLVSAFATGDLEAGTVTILIVNRDLERSVTCRISVQMTGLSAAPQLSVRTLQFESLLNTNLVEPTVRAPLPIPDSKRVVAKDDFKVTIEPAGIALLILEPKEVD